MTARTIAALGLASTLVVLLSVYGVPTASADRIPWVATASSEDSVVPSAIPKCPQILSSDPQILSTTPPPVPLSPCPGVVYGSFFGSALDDRAVETTLDPAGNLYVVGDWWGWPPPADFPTTPGALDRAMDKGYKVFAARFDATGTVTYSTLLGGKLGGVTTPPGETPRSGLDEGAAIGVDSSGNMYIAGSTTSPDFPTTAPFKGTYHRIDKGFVTKLSPDGGTLLYSRFLGGSSSDGILDMFVDQDGYAYVTGWTHSKDFPTTPDALQSVQAAIHEGDGFQEDGFISILDPDGALVYSTLLGGEWYDQGASIVADKLGNVYVAGFTLSSNFPVTPDAFDTSLSCYWSCSYDAFVIGLSPPERQLVFSTFLGGYDHDFGLAIALDEAGNVYVTGQATSVYFPVTADAARTTMGGRADAFVTKFDPKGNLVYSTFLGGSGSDHSGSIAVDQEGYAYVAGFTESRDFPTTEGAFDATYNEPDSGLEISEPCTTKTNGFVTKISPDGQTLNYSTFLGWVQGWTGAGCILMSDGAQLEVDSLGNTYVVGTTLHRDFPATEGAIDTTWNGGEDVFVVKIELIPEPNRPPVASFTPDRSGGAPNEVTVNASRSADAEDVTALLQVRWDWENDGAWDTPWSTVKQASHVYPTAGTHTIRLEVRDTANLTDETTRTVAIPTPSAVTDIGIAIAVLVAAGIATAVGSVIYWRMPSRRRS